MAAGAALAIRTPVFAQPAESARPAVPWGVQSGEVTETTAVVWSATDRPARMVVEYATNERWITADVHYCATHRYEPERAVFTDFAPFYEFVSGPIHAGGFGPNALDATLGPRVVFAKTPPRPNTPPGDGFLNFGHVRIDGRTSAMTVTHRDLAGAVLHETRLSPSGAPRPRA